MIKSIELAGKSIRYDFQCKKVKNINLRIKPDGSISVSANRRVPQKTIDAFLVSKEAFILNALKKIENGKRKTLIRYFDENEIRQVIVELCKKMHPYFEKRGVRYPVIKFRKMVSQWGNCHPAKGVLTFSTNLVWAPLECIEYVVLHEFTHFLQANHSKEFYTELERVCPEYKSCRQMLKEISIR